MLHALPLTNCAVIGEKTWLKSTHSAVAAHEMITTRLCLCLCVRRVLGLLEEAERQYRQLEDRHCAAHCAYLRALVQDALGQATGRNATAASHAALLQPALD